MSVEDSARESLEDDWSQFLHVARQEHDVDDSVEQNTSDRRVQRGRIVVCLRRQMNGRHIGLASPLQGASVAVVAHDHRDARLDTPSGTGIQQALQRRSLVRGENSKVHGWAGDNRDD